MPAQPSNLSAMKKLSYASLTEFRIVGDAKTQQWPPYRRNDKDK